ncbi:MAG: hypothetical protein WC806_06190, partial [Candidatus Gracilibacteria bacterium]
MFTASLQQAFKKSLFKENRFLFITEASTKNTFTNPNAIKNTHEIEEKFKEEKDKIIQKGTADRLQVANDQSVKLMKTNELTDVLNKIEATPDPETKKEFIKKLLNPEQQNSKISIGEGPSAHEVQFPKLYNYTSEDTARLIKLCIDNDLTEDLIKKIDQNGPLTAYHINQESMIDLFSLESLITDQKIKIINVLTISATRTSELIELSRDDRFGILPMLRLIAPRTIPTLISNYPQVFSAKSLAILLENDKITVGDITNVPFNIKIQILSIYSNSIEINEDTQNAIRTQLITNEADFNGLIASNAAFATDTILREKAYAKIKE